MKDKCKIHLNVLISIFILKSNLNEVLCSSLQGFEQEVKVESRHTNVNLQTC